MTNVIRKDAYRVFWLVKGHFNATEECIFDCYDSYFKRVWYNEESWMAEEGFDEAWEEYQLKEVEKVACKGGHFDQKRVE